MTRLIQYGRATTLAHKYDYYDFENGHGLDPSGRWVLILNDVVVGHLADGQHALAWASAARQHGHECRVHDNEHAHMVAHRGDKPMKP